MPPTNVVVDGSNIATEGRSTPSLEQLDQAVRQYLEEHPGTSVTVVVDASFGHRIDPSERPAFEEAVAHGELVSPPAGAIGRGDAFLLRIAERIGAWVLSNDSFREFHSEHPWLFDEGRLVGGTPVPGVGWIFTPRRPVRGPLTPGASGNSRRGDKKAAERPGDDEPIDVDGTAPKAKRAQKAQKTKKSAATSGRGKDGSALADGGKPKARKRGPSRGKGTDRSVEAAIAQATEEALVPGETKKKAGSKRRDSKAAAPEAVNDPLPFITFASEHPVGSQFEGTVVSFTSHGAMAQVKDMLCYVPLAGLGDPPPRRARDVLRLGDKRVFESVVLDPARRGAQLALPEMVAVHGEIAEGAEEAASEVRGRRKKASTAAKAPAVKAAKAAKAAKPAEAAKTSKREGSARKAERSEKTAPVKKAAGKRAPTALQTRATKKPTGPKKATPTKKAASKAAVPAKASVQVKKAPAKKAPLKKAAPSKKAAGKKVAAAKSQEAKSQGKR